MNNTASQNCQEDNIIPLLQPVSCKAVEEDAVRQGEKVLLSLHNGKRCLGRLQTFLREEKKLSITLDGKNKPQEVPFSKIKIMSLPRRHSWRRAKLQGDVQEAMSQPDLIQDFWLTFKDGDKLEGSTFGFRTDAAGLYLYPTQNGSDYAYMFVPRSALEDHRIGPHLGELLVEDQVVSQEQVEESLSEQEQIRQQPLGEYLRSKAIITTNELEASLKNQKTTPNLRLGEILIHENIITEEQLMEALQAQQEDRSKQIGQILIEQGLVSECDIQQGLSKKLGIPFVDVGQFQLDAEALKLVPEDLVKKYTFLPLYAYDQKLVIAMVNPMDWETLDAVRFHTGLNVEPVMAEPNELQRVIGMLYATPDLEGDMLDEFMGNDDDSDEEEYDETSSSDNVIVKLVNKIIIDAYNQGASDIHIEPYPGKSKTIVRLRRDGELRNYYEIPGKMRNALIARIKIMANLDISEKRKPQDGKIDFKKFSMLKIELRVATIPTSGDQEDVVMRILASGEPVPLDKLGLSEENRTNLMKMVSKPYGLFFVCGPTGSGKTTTLHSILGYLNTPERKIWTAEDPVEITQKGLRQVQVHPKIGLTFAAAMRAFLRADPDIIMVGEMRDEETTSTGIEASLTGHLVFATLHTNSAPESIIRLLDMGMDPFNFSDALVGILAQRLGKRLCSECKEAYEPDSEELRELLAEYCYELIPRDADEEYANMVRHKILEDWKRKFADEEGRFTLYRAPGCEACEGSGYKGRVGLHELLEATDNIKKKILEKAQVSELLAAALQEGMRTLKQDGIEKVLQGLTDIHAVRTVCIK
ncbi:MAG TPA: pilus assembly protein PilB [Gammaproteobacteria bacterium]|nr:pilus assembly protein PilB [Gammaproteobacteria bacterium]